MAREKKLAQSRKTPYWWGVIERARVRKRDGLPAFTEAQIDKSADWVTCACGKQDARIPRRGPGGVCGPVDKKLGDLGVKFCGAVSRHAPAKAEALLLQIEKRAAEIINGGAR